MSLVMGVADQVMVLEAGRMVIAGHTRRGAARSARDRGLSRPRGRRGVMLELHGSVAGYGAGPVLHDIDLDGATPARSSP